ncbi:MAG: hybrid sensor histidine kinase/response regulator [Deferrisomatales bacterium]
MGEALRVLIVDDEPDDRLLARRELEREFGVLEVREAAGPEAFAAALAAGPLDLVITDYRIRWTDGLAVLRRVKEWLPDCPVIMFTGTGTEEVAVEAMKDGLDDYVVKTPAHFPRLSAAARKAIDRRAQRRRLRDAEARYRELFENVPVGLYRSTPDGRLLDANPALAELFAYPDPRSMLAVDLKRTYADPGDRERFRAVLERDGVIRGFETRLKDREGRPRWVQLSARVVRDDRGRVLHYEGSLENVEGRRRAEQEQTRQLARIRTILDHAPQGMALLDTDGRLLAGNARAQNLLAELAAIGGDGRVSEISGRSLGDLGTLTPDGAKTHELFLEGPPPRVFEAAAHAVEHPDGAGGWVLTLEDVTRDREVQDKLAAQERLAALGQLAAGIAHDFNNILQAVTGSADLVRTDPTLSDRSRARLEVVVEQGFRAAELIRQILDFSRRSPSRRRPLDMVSFLKEVSRLFERALPETVSLTFEYPPGSPWVSADPAQLQQVLANLVVNARDALPAGGRIRVVVRPLRVEPGDRPPVPGMEPGLWLSLSVGDTGPGIAPEHLPHIFEPFYTTKGPGQGTGLGLAQVYGLVRQHDGFIDVASQPGRGAMFTVYLPAVARREAVPPPEDQEPLPRGSGETVLVVDDDPVVLETTRALLDGLGYQVLTARDGREALNVLTRDPAGVAALLTDMVMPGMGGVELAGELERRRLGLPLLLMTGYPLGDEGEPGPSIRGATAVLSKPVRRDRLARAMARALRRPA